MRIFLPILAALVLLAPPAFAQSAWRTAGEGRVVSVTTSASTPQRLVGFSTDQDCTQVTIHNTGSVDAYVELAATSALAVPDIPAAGNPGTSFAVQAGTRIDVSTINKPYLSAKTSSGSTTLVAVCSTGTWRGTTGILLGSGTSSTQVQGPVADGAADTAANPVEFGGTDGTNIQTVKTDSSGELQVDVLSQIPGTGATNAGKAEDGAHTTGDTGTMVLGVRNEAGVAFADTAGDYSPIAVNRVGQVGTTCSGAPTSSISADTTSKTGAGSLCGIFVASSTSCTVKIWDNTANSGTVLVDTFSVVAATWYPLPFMFGTGLRIDVTGTCALTAAFN